MLVCAGLGWDRVNFLHSSWYGAMLWIYAENSVDNSGMFSLLLSSAYAASRPFLPLTPHVQWGGWDAQEVGRGHSRDSWSQLTQGIFQTIWGHAQHVKLGKKKEGGTLGAMAFVFPSPRYACWSPAVLEMDEHLPADGKRWMNSFFCFACVCGFCSTYSTVFISTHEFSHFCPSSSLPHPTGAGCERATVWGLVASWG